MKKEKSTVTVCTETGEVLSPSLTPQEKSLGFRRFIQLNCEYSNFLCNFAAKHPKALAILLFLEKNANTRNASCVTQKALCQQFKISNTTVWRQLKILQKANLIYVKKDKGLNFYIINPEIVWKGTPIQRYLCEFPRYLTIDKDETKGKTHYTGSIL